MMRTINLCAFCFLSLFFQTNLLLAQPAAGTYDWENLTDNMAAASSDTTPTTLVIGSGLTAIGEGDGTRGVKSVHISNGPGTTALRFESPGQTSVLKNAILKSTSGKEFKLNQLKFWVSRSATPGVVTITAKKDGMVTGSVAYPYTASTPIQVTVSANINFQNIDELVFSGFGEDITLDDVMITGAVTAPLVDVLSFKANQSLQGVLVQWSVSPEENYNHFTLEHSSDGTSFTSIATVPAEAADNNRTSYSYTDLNPVQGNNYYRLLQYTGGGNTRNFGTRVVTIKTQANAKAYPNPIEGNEVTIYLGHAIDKPVSYQITDLNGEIFQKGILTESVQTITVGNLSKGLFILRLSTGQTIKLDKK